jgi:hypothetical protein
VRGPRSGRLRVERSAVLSHRESRRDPGGGPRRERLSGAPVQQSGARLRCCGAVLRRFPAPPRNRDADRRAAPAVWERPLPGRVTPSAWAHSSRLTIPLVASGGEGIRTPGALARTADFKSETTLHQPVSTRNQAPRPAGRCTKMHVGPPEAGGVGQAVGPGSHGPVADASGLLANFIPPKERPPRAVAARTLAASVVAAFESGDARGARAAARALVELVEVVGKGGAMVG